MPEWILDDEETRTVRLEVPPPVPPWIAVPIGLGIVVLLGYMVTRE